MFCFETVKLKYLKILAYSHTALMLNPAKGHITVLNISPLHYSGAKRAQSNTFFCNK